MILSCGRILQLATSSNLSEGREDGEFDIDNIDLVADITHYCIKGLEVPFIYGRLGHGMNVESSKPLVAKVVYGALGKSGLKL